MHQIIALSLILSFFATPWQIVNRMVKKTTFGGERVEIRGTEEGTDAPVVLVYDRAKDMATLTVGKEESRFEKDNIPGWMRLFFMKSFEKPAEHTDALVVLLRSIGIDTTKKMLSTTAPGGDLTVVIGRTSVGETAPAVAFYRSSALPFRLSAAAQEITFEEYHKSTLPLTFPGRITIENKSKKIVYVFLRNEYR